jgi:hypothetical protein
MSQGIIFKIKCETNSAKAGWFSKRSWNNLSNIRKLYLLKCRRFPDGLSLAAIYLRCDLLKKGVYPWGVTRRMYMR